MQNKDDPSTSRLVLAYARPDAARPSPSILQWIIGSSLGAALLAGAGLSALHVFDSRDPSLFILAIGFSGLAWGLYRSLVRRHREAALWMTLITMVLTALTGFFAVLFLGFERGRSKSMFPLALSVTLGVCAWQFYRWHCTLERAEALRDEDATANVGQQS